jgi:type IV pilus assembly protein PilE
VRAPRRFQWKLGGTARPSVGFTLHDVLITIAVLAILATIAIANHLNQVIRTRRADARQTLTGVAAELDRCYSLLHAYDSPGCGAVTGDGTVELESRKGYYHIRSTMLEAESYILQASPQGRQISDQTCARLIITSEKTVRAWDESERDTSAECWN